MTTPFHLSIEKTLAIENKVLETIILNDGLIIVTHDNQQFSAINGNMEVIWTKPADLKTENYVYPSLTMHPQGHLYAIANINSIRICSIEGDVLFNYQHDAWQPFLGTECFFTNDYAFFVTPSETGDQLIVINLADYKILHTYSIEGDQEYNYSFITTPDPNIVLLDFAAGQEDARQFKLEIQDNGALEINEIESCIDRVFGAFSPSGTEFVTAPHYDEGIEVYSFPEMEMIAELSQETLFEGREEEYPAESDDSLNYHSTYLNDNIILTITRFGRLLLINRETMTCFGELILEGSSIKAYNFSGQPVGEGEEIEDYEGDISDVKILGNRLLVRTTEGRLSTYPLSF